ncbi:MAG: hypothetical protein IJ191_09310 [Treponema sp.]|nr:hypothetical protein [Treponema sp.]
MCWKCGTTIDVAESIFRSSTCAVCGADMHCCRNCRLYSPGAQYDCAETAVELVREKEHSNFCDFFSVRMDFFRRTDAAAAQRARDAFNNLFGSIACE